MTELLQAMRAAHLELTADEHDHVLAAAHDLLALTNTLPAAPTTEGAVAATPVLQLRPDTVLAQTLQPEQFAPAVQDGFIRVPRVID